MCVCSVCPSQATPRKLLKSSSSKLVDPFRLVSRACTVAQFTRFAGSSRGGRGGGGGALDRTTDSGLSRVEISSINGWQRSLPHKNEQMYLRSGLS